MSNRLSAAFTGVTLAGLAIMATGGGRLTTHTNTMNELIEQEKQIRELIGDDNPHYIQANKQFLETSQSVPGDMGLMAVGGLVFAVGAAGLQLNNRRNKSPAP